MRYRLIWLLLLLCAVSVWGQQAQVEPPQSFEKRVVWKNVKNFGAKGDGSTDDRAAIQSAISACSTAGGGTVYFPRGTYLHDSVILVPSNITLQGTGIGSEILFDTTSAYGEQFSIRNANWDTTAGSWTTFWGGVTGQYPPYPSYADSAACVSAEGEECHVYHELIDSNISLIGLYINGGKAYTEMDSVIADSPATHGIEMRFVHNALIRDCYVSNTHNDGIAVRGCTDSRVLNCVLWDIGEDGIILSGWGARRNLVQGNILKMRDSTFKGVQAGAWQNTVGSGLVSKSPEVAFVDNIVMFGGQGGELHDEDGTPLRDITYKNNMFLGCLSGGIAVRDGSNINIEGNTFRDIGARGVYAYENADQLSVRGNYFEGMRHHAIHIGAGHGHVVENNQINSNYNSAIKLESVQWSKVLGNIVMGVDSGDGIRIQTSKHSTISGNTVSKADSNGIYISGYSTQDEYMTIGGNVCDSNGRHGIILSNVDVSSINGNVCSDNDSGTTGLYSGIYLTAANSNVVEGNVCVSPGGTQTYGIQSASSNRNIITGNQVFGNDSGQVYGTSNTDIVHSNRKDTTTAGHTYIDYRVGIGTFGDSSATSLLHILGDYAGIRIQRTTGANSFLGLDDSTGAGWRIRYDSATSELQIRRNGASNYVRIKTTGQVVVAGAAYSYALPVEAPTTGEVIKATSDTTSDWASDETAEAGTGDIDGVTAGDGLTGGGTAGTVTLDVVGGLGLIDNADSVYADTSFLATQTYADTTIRDSLAAYFDTAQVVDTVQALTASDFLKESDANVDTAAWNAAAGGGVTSAEVGDTADVVRGEITDTLTARGFLTAETDPTVDDTAAAIRANIHDSLIADTAVFLASLTRLGKITDDTTALIAAKDSVAAWDNGVLRDTFFVAESTVTVTGWKSIGDTIFIDTTGGSGTSYNWLDSAQYYGLDFTGDTIYLVPSSGDTCKIYDSSGIVINCGGGATFLDSAYAYRFALIFAAGDTVRFPRTEGTAGQVLKYSDAGDSLYWADDASASWDWSDSSSHGPDSVLFADSANHADSATGAQRATTDASGNTITSTYETITNVGKIGDDTTALIAAKDSVAAWDNGDYPEDDPVWVSDSADYAMKNILDDSVTKKNVFRHLDHNYFDTTGTADSVKVIFSDSATGAARATEALFADAATTAGGISGNLDPDQLTNDAVDDNKVDSNLIPKVSASAFADSAGAVDTAHASIQGALNNVRSEMRDSAAAAGITEDEPTFYGDLTIIDGQIQRWDELAYFDTLSIHTAVPNTKLWLPQFNPTWNATDSDRYINELADSSHALHITGYAIPGGLWDHCDNDRVVLGYGPIAKSDADENPHLAGSADGVTFSELKFDWDDDGDYDDTLHNPIFLPTDTVIWGIDTTAFTPETLYTLNVGGNGDHLSDQDVFASRSGRTYLPYRLTFGTNNDSNAIAISYSDSGIDWSAPRMIFSYGWTPGGGDFMSPSFTPTKGDTMWCHAVEMKAATGLDSTWIVLWKNDGVRYDSGWYLVDTCTYTPYNSGNKAWHVNVIEEGDRRWGLVVECKQDSAGAYAKLVLASISDDGLTWRGLCNIQVPDATPTDHGDSILSERAYRSWMYKEFDGDNYNWILYLCGYGSGTLKWGTVRAQLKFDTFDTTIADFQTFIDNNYWEITDTGTTANQGPLMGEQWIRDSTILKAAYLNDTLIDTVDVYVIMDILGKDNASGDSTRLTFPIFQDTSGGGIVGWAIEGRDTIWAADQVDTVYATTNELPFGTFYIDSLRLWSKMSSSTGTTIKIDQMSILKPGEGSLFPADSIVVDTTNDYTNAAANTWAAKNWDLGAGINTLTGTYGQQVTARFVVAGDAGAYVDFGRIELWCKITRKLGVR